MTDIAALTAADKATVSANRYHKGAFPWLGLAAGDRLSVYIAAVEAIQAQHSIERRYQPHPDADHSLATAEQVASDSDMSIEDVTYFEICGYCGELEVPHDCDDEYRTYRDSLWPCATVRALDLLTIDHEPQERTT